MATIRITIFEQIRSDDVHGLVVASLWQQSTQMLDPSHTPITISYNTPSVLCLLYITCVRYFWTNVIEDPLNGNITHRSLHITKLSSQTQASVQMPGALYIGSLMWSHCLDMAYGQQCSSLLPRGICDQAPKVCCIRRIVTSLPLHNTMTSLRSHFTSISSYVQVRICE